MSRVAPDDVKQKERSHPMSYGEHFIKNECGVYEGSK